MKKILNKSDTTEIYKRTADKLGVSVDSIRNEILSYWIDIDQMFNYCCGYSTYVNKFGHFIMYTKDMYKFVSNCEKVIRKYLLWVRRDKEYGSTERLNSHMESIATTTTKVIFLYYSVKLYQDEVLSSYPKKYKVDIECFERAIKRIEELFNIPITKFPVTINYPIQKIYMQILRSKGLLQNPVVYKYKKV